jgi:hypothetical protein
LKGAVDFAIDKLVIIQNNATDYRDINKILKEGGKKEKK